MVKKNEDDITPTNIISGNWYHWGSKFRRAHQDWFFLNNMTLHKDMHCCFLVDEVKQVCLMRYLTGTDLHNCKNGSRNLSNLKTIITVFIEEHKKGSLCSSLANSLYYKSNSATHIWLYIYIYIYMYGRPFFKNNSFESL